MVCQHCKKNKATVQFIETINGETCEVLLCDECYAYKYGEFESEATNALLNGLFGNGARRQVSRSCPVCGSKFSDYERTGLVGCASCYDVFKEELMSCILRIQGNTEHVGSVGVENSPEHDLRIKLKTMQDKMEKALISGNYREASMLNMKMQELKKRFNGGDSDV